VARTLSFAANAPSKNEPEPRQLPKAKQDQQLMTQPKRAEREYQRVI